MINRPHLKKLKSSLKKYGCIEPVSIFFGAEYFEAYPERELTGFNAEKRNTPETLPKFPPPSLLRMESTGRRHTQNYFQRMKPTNTP